MLNAYLDNRVASQLQTKLDGNDFNESELISIKVPATHLTYYNYSDRFVRVDGQIEISGVQYNYVKRRLYNDSIEMLCIPNRAAIHLTKVKGDFYRLVNDLQNPGQEKKTDSHASKNFSYDYFTLNILLNIVNPFSDIKRTTSLYNRALAAGSKSTNEHPPQQTS